MADTKVLLAYEVEPSSLFHELAGNMSYADAIAATFPEGDVRIALKKQAIGDQHVPRAMGLRGVRRMATQNPVRE